MEDNSENNTSKDNNSENTPVTEKITLDPERVSKNKVLIEKIANSDNEEEIKGVVDELLPGWFKYAFLDYSDDYPHLKNNWHKMCENLNCTPQKIICVEEIPLKYNKDKDDNFFEIQAVIEILIRKGYVIRRKNELEMCKICKKALLPERIFNEIKKIGKIDNLPEIWANVCINCK